MSGGKFDNQIWLDSKGILSPQGPLELDAGETALRLDIWVYQDNAAYVAVQRSFPPPPGGTWTADPATAVYTGQFQLGPATAMALLLSTTASGIEAYQWTKGILLVPK